MVDVAQRKYSEAPHSSLQGQVSFVMEDAQALSFPNSSFDTVLDTFGVCSMQSPLEMLCEMRRVCKPGGKVLLLEHGVGNMEWLNNYLHKHAVSHATRWGCWWDRDILALCNEAGLEVLDYQRKHFGTTYLIIARPRS
eukprot:c17249_g1_i2.p1 GENE.c17249_g1_i2~~c17249_g1_i2.p1  ORF type:complete len:138 (-),score=29.64 c17249_g1_i2:31-444(-)